jgi:hypothetical protein
MSVIEYKYQRATHEQLMKCLRWCQNQLQLRDWQITLETGPLPIKAYRGDDNVLLWCGAVNVITDRLTAEIWVNTPLHKDTDRNPYATVIHEALHVFLTERGEDCEQIVRILEPMLYRLYCMEKGLKIAKVKLS